jgi:hypothetical protein
MTSYILLKSSEHIHTKSSVGIFTTGGSSVASSAVITRLHPSNSDSLFALLYSDSGFPNILILVPIFGIGMAETIALSFSFDVRSMMDEAIVVSDNETGKMFSL